MKSHITYNQLLKLVEFAIFTRPIIRNRIDTSDLSSINGAFKNGLYIGSPGKDIYFMLPFLDDKQIDEVADSLTIKFPFSPIYGNPHCAACVRFIYGQFEKQGILRSDDDMERMKNKELNWELPRKFLSIVRKKMKEKNNYYGLCILCEMEGHRLGDEAVLNKDDNKLIEMENMYLKSIKYAHKCNSYKHMFSLYYWAFMYFKKFSNKSKAIEYAKLSIENAGKYYYNYFPKGDQYYSIRLLRCVKYLKNKISNDRYIKFRKNNKTTIKKLKVRK